VHEEVRLQELERGARGDDLTQLTCWAHGAVGGDEHCGAKALASAHGQRIERIDEEGVARER
jgi:hypothetical protein